MRFEIYIPLMCYSILEVSELIVFMPYVKSLEVKILIYGKR